jgi:hypothetical protein
MKSGKKGPKSRLAVLLGVLLAACFLTTTAQADTLYKGKFTLSNEVHWGKATLPAGNYILKLDGSNQTLTVEDADKGVTLVREFARIGGADPQGDGELRIAVRGRQRTIYSIRLAGMGEVFHTKGGLTRAEQEAAGSESLKSVPITVAEQSEK